MRKKHDTTRTVQIAEVQVATSDACLVLIYGAPELGKRFELKNDIVIGRDRSSDLFVEAGDVSRQHAKLTERRLKKLGGNVGVVGKAGELASRGVAATKGPLHAVRGTGEEEVQLKNAKTEYSEEHEEIGVDW